MSLLNWLLCLGGYRSHYLISFEYSVDGESVGTGDIDISTPGFFTARKLQGIREAIKEIQQRKTAGKIDQVVILNIHRFWL